MTSLKKKSVSGLFWDFSGKIGLQGVGFFVSIILARILSPEDFGLLAIITVFISLANVFLDFGFGTALVQRSEVTEEHYSSVFFMNLIMGCLLGTIVFTLAPYIADFYKKNVLTNLIRAMSVCFIINAFGNVTRAHLRREMNFKILSYSSIGAAIISGIVAVFMAYNGFGIWSLVTQVIISELLTNVFLYFGCKIHFSLRFSFQSLKELWSVSGGVFLSGLIDMLYFNIDSLLIGKLVSPIMLGYYYRSKSLENFSFRYTATSVSNILLPTLGTIKNDSLRLNNAVLKIFHLLSIVSYVFCGILLVSANEIIILLFSEKWKTSVLLFQILIAGSFASQIGSLFYNILLSTGDMKKYTRIVTLNYILLTLNFVTLFVFDLITYLYVFVFLRVIVAIVAAYFTSDSISVLKIIFWQSVKYLFIYIVTIVFVFSIKGLFTTSSMILDLILFSSTYLIIFVMLAYVTKIDGLKLFYSEFIFPLLKKM